MIESLKVVNSFLDYQKQSWMHGCENLEAMQDKLKHLQKLIGAIEHFERKAATAFNDSQEPSKLGFDHYHHKYEICKASSERLHQTFNNEINETQL